MQAGRSAELPPVTCGRSAHPPREMGGLGLPKPVVVVETGNL
jgi:hypothetical protein